MKLLLKKKNRIAVIVAILSAAGSFASADTVPDYFSRAPEWRIGVDVSPAWVPGSNGYLKGNNPENRNIRANLSGDIRGEFSFNPATRLGMLYKDLYQGIGIGFNSYFAGSLLGTPVSAYVYQGGPIVRLSRQIWLGYEWEFGAAFGWKHYDNGTNPLNQAVGTTVTAHMGLGIKFHYEINDRWRVSAGVKASHYSNGNTSWPNGGVNDIGVSLGMAYTLNPQKSVRETSPEIEEEADRGRWLYDIMVFGAWRKRILKLGTEETPTVIPGKFGILGLQFAPLRTLNRWVAVGPALDIQWDESAGLAPYYIEGSFDDEIRFRRPPFGKQLNIGVSAHVELTMPIFSVNIGLGYDFLNPKGDKAFYQSLTLKTFVTKNIYLNTGYRLGNFKHPQNLMLGVGIRL